jgi:LCP family protein required for cell wall assembly
MLGLIGMGLIALALLGMGACTAGSDQTAIPSETGTPTVRPSPTLTPEPPTATATPRPTATPTPTPICGGPREMLILLVGADNRTDWYVYGLADVIRIVRADFVNQKIGILAIPRAIQVEVPGIEDHGITSGLLNQSYFWGTPGMGYYDGPGEGAGLLARTLDHNFGLRVDHYFAVNMPTFRRFINSIGGVFVYVPENYNRQFYAGSHYFNGSNALAYARLRYVDNIFKRQERQNALILAIHERLLSPDWIGEIPRLIDAFDGRVRTDLSLEQLSQLACLGLALSEDDIWFVSLTRDLFETRRNESGMQAFYADFDLLSDMMADFAEGRWPSYATPTPTATEPP